LLFTSRDPNEAAELHKLIESYRWKLRLHSRGESNLTDLALFRLDSLLLSATDATNGTSGNPSQELNDQDTFSALRDAAEAPIPSGFMHESPRADFEALGSASDTFSIHNLNLNAALNARTGADLDFEYWMNNSPLFGIYGTEADKEAMNTMSVLPDFLQIDEGSMFRC